MGLQQWPWSLFCSLLQHWLPVGSSLRAPWLFFLTTAVASLTATSVLPLPSFHSGQAVFVSTKLVSVDLGSESETHDWGKSCAPTRGRVGFYPKQILKC